MDQHSGMKRDQITDPIKTDLIEVYEEKTWVLWEVMSVGKDNLTLRIWQKNQVETKIYSREEWVQVLITNVAEGKMQIKVIPNKRNKVN